MCEFKGHDTFVILRLEKSRYESEVTGETLRNFYSREDQNIIEIIQTRFTANIKIYIINAARRLRMKNVDSDLSISDYIDIYIGEKGHNYQTLSVFELEMINCRLSGQIRLFLTFPNSFAKFKFENTGFEEIVFNSVLYAGLASYVFDNCTFTKALHVDIQRFVGLKILRSSINVPHDCYGTVCDVRLTGVDDDFLISDRELTNIFFNRTHQFSPVDIVSSSFQGGHGPFFTICQANLGFNKTVFHIQSHRTRPENLIDIDLSSKYSFMSLHTVSLIDVLINITSIDRDVQQVNIMSIVANFGISKTSKLCVH